MLKARVKFTIRGLIDTAIEKICVLGTKDAMPEIAKLKEVAEDIACFWGFEELESYFSDTVGPVLFAEDNE